MHPIKLLAAKSMFFYLVLADNIYNAEVHNYWQKGGGKYIAGSF